MEANPIEERKEQPMLVLLSTELARILANCKMGHHVGLIAIQGIHSIADNETVQWCSTCGSVVTKVLEGLDPPDQAPHIFNQLVEVA